jgi:hypothetical protein
MSSLVVRSRALLRETTSAAGDTTHVRLLARVNAQVQRKSDGRFETVAALAANTFGRGFDDFQPVHRLAFNVSAPADGIGIGLGVGCVSDADSRVFGHFVKLKPLHFDEKLIANRTNERIQNLAQLFARVLRFQMIEQNSRISKPPVAQFTYVRVYIGLVVNAFVILELIVADKGLRAFRASIWITPSYSTLVILSVIVFVPCQHETTIERSRTSGTRKSVSRFHGRFRIELLVDVFVSLPHVQIPERLLTSRTRKAHLVLLLPGHSPVILLVFGKMIRRVVHKRTMGTLKADHHTVDGLTLHPLVNELMLL